MKITEAKLRQILREESRRVRLFESDAGSDNGNQIKFVDQNLKASNPKLWAIELDLEKAVRGVLYGGTGVWNAIKDFGNFRVDAGMFFKDLSWGEGGDFADLETADREEITKKTYLEIKANKLSEQSFYDIVKQQFLSNPNTQNDPDLPEKETASTREGTDDYAEKLIGIQTTYHETLKKEGLAPATQGAAPASAAPGTPGTPGTAGAAGATSTAKPGQKVIPAVTEIQKLMNFSQQDGKWTPEMQAAFQPWLTELLRKNIVKMGAAVLDRGTPSGGAATTQLTNTWAKYARSITEVNGKPTPGGFEPTAQGILSFIKTLQAPAGSGASQPVAPVPAAEGSWRRGTRINESDRRIRITWGR